MTDKELNLEIAQICGWKRSKWGGYTGISDGWEGPEGQLDMPHYINDLNAMHEAEKTLTQEECFKYAGKLLRLATEEIDKKGINMFEMVSAPARVRAEAFYQLKTKDTPYKHVLGISD